MGGGAIAVAGMGRAPKNLFRLIDDTIRGLDSGQTGELDLICIVFATLHVNGDRNAADRTHHRSNLQG
jgi:hypothetical protein